MFELHQARDDGDRSPARPIAKIGSIPFVVRTASSIQMTAIGENEPAEQVLIRKVWQSVQQRREMAPN